MRYQDVEEELMKILAGGGQQDEGDVLAAINARTPSDASIAEAAENERLAAQGRLPGDMPRGTKVVFSMDAPMDVAAPEPTRTPIAPKVVDLTQESPDDLEMAYASAQDRKARQRDAFERGSRQLVAGLTRTNVVESNKRPVDAVSMLMARRKERGAVEQRNEQNRLGAAKFNYEQADGARKEALRLSQRDEDKKTAADNEKWRREEAARDNERGERGIAATERLAGANFGLRRDDAETKKTERGDRIAAGAIPLFDGTLQTPPGLNDTERNRAREQAGLWNAADEATGQLEGALQAYVARPSAETAQNITALLGGASTALNTAYGQGAMAEAEAKRMADTLGADIRSLGGMTALFDRAMGNPEAGKLLLTKIKTARSGNRAVALARLRTSGQFAQGGGDAQSAQGAPARKTATNPKTGEKIEWNGKEWVPVR